jgi:hypothetical protein
MTGHVHDLATALAEEFAAIHPPSPPIADEADYRRRAEAAGQSALCLSGGGIRSASFSLGVIQALARAGLLARFDYLSTVSGGGFTGSWLSMLIKQTGSASAAEAALAKSSAAPAVAALREYTDYLSPQGGLFSADTWTGIVLYLRNVMINWAVIGPLLVLAVLAAIFYRTLLWSVGMHDWAALLAEAVGIAALVVGTWRACLDLPSHRPEGRGHAVRYLPEAAVMHRIVVPAMVWGFVLPLTLARWLAVWDDGTIRSQVWLPGVYIAAMLIGYWGAATGRRGLALYWHNFGAWLLATLASSLLIWFGLHLAHDLKLPPDDQAETLAVVAPLWLIVTNLLQSTVHVALRKEARLGDLDREWLARLSALKLRVAVAWTLFAFCSLSLQRVAFHAPGSDWPSWAVPLIAVVSGPTAAWLGKQVFSRVQAMAEGPGGLNKLLQWALPLLALLFIAALFTTLGYVTGEALGILQAPLRQTPPVVLLLVQIGIAVVLLALSWHANRRVNINRFSMHGVYRNRLTRAFLGAARPSRRPDPFTGFDPDDNPRMASLATPLGPRKLFPVINVALNLTASARAAWAERKAAAFTITPLACGSAILSPPDSTAVGCYAPTALYAGQEHETAATTEMTGMSLATAMTISGAAVSPNWGYHSSPITAFLMTLFNVRLGAWLPNPAVVKREQELRLGYPRGAFAPMLHDLLGSASDTTRAIYLSDGGHFDNLGLYEMLRRRCRLILVVDAGQDPDCAYADLGDAVRKAAIDQQIVVEFADHNRICGRYHPSPDALEFAVATISYPEGGSPGRLLYIKPCYLDDIPTDVRAYGAAHAMFPHESTLDQWFSESQFESYRHLGEHQMNRLIGLLSDARCDLAALFAAAHREQAGFIEDALQDIT